MLNPGRISRTLILCLTLIAGAVPGLTTPDPMPLFAACTGRLSALMEFQWLVQDQGADQTRRRRDAMADLLDAALPPDRAVQAMDLRLQSKVALAALLTQAAFNRDQARAAWAWRRAQGLLTECTSVLLS